MLRSTAYVALIAVILLSPLLAGCSSADAHTRTIYTCPMHTNIIGAEGAKCSTCGMQLVAKEVRTGPSDSGSGRSGGSSGDGHTGHSH